MSYQPRLIDRAACSGCVGSCVGPVDASTEHGVGVQINGGRDGAGEVKAAWCFKNQSRYCCGSARSPPRGDRQTD